MTFAPADMGRAWVEVEAAMPSGWRGPTLTRVRDGYRAEAFRLAPTTGPHAYVTQSEVGLASDPVTALEVLAGKLHAARDGA